MRLGFLSKSSRYFFLGLLCLNTLACAGSKAKPQPKDSASPTASDSATNVPTADSTKKEEKEKSAISGKVPANSSGTAATGNANHTGSANSTATANYGDRSDFQGPPMGEAQKWIQIRKADWNRLLTGTDSLTRTTAARDYLYHFEYIQALALGKNISDSEKAELLKEAMQTFLEDAQSIAPADGKVLPSAQAHPTDPDHEENKAEAFNTLARVMTASNLGFQETDANPGFDTVIMKGLIVRNNSTGSGAISEVQNREQVAQQLLQARHNVLVWNFVLSVKTPRDAGWKRLYNWAVDWNLDLDAFNLAQLERLTEKYLEPAVRTRGMLEKAGIRAIFGAPTWIAPEEERTIFKNMQVKFSRTKDERLGVMRSRVAELIAKLQRD